MLRKEFERHDVRAPPSWQSQTEPSGCIARDLVHSSRRPRRLSPAGLPHRPEKARLAPARCVLAHEGVPDVHGLKVVRVVIAAITPSAPL